MILDYNPERELYVLRVDRRTDPFTPEELMTDYGLEFSLPASTRQEAVMFTAQPYAAATFAAHATPAARAKLDWILHEIEASRAEHSNRHFDVPDDHELWDYQKADLEYMLRRDRVLDADEPGLGKTPTAIAYANEIQAQRVLCIVPASIRFQWLRRILEWSTMGTTYDVPDQMAYAITSSKAGVHPRAAWTVASYEMARSPGILEALRKTDYDLLILDEAHYLKTVGSKRSRAVFGGGHDPLYHEALAERAKRVVALSGTPLPNRPREAYVLAKHFNHGAIDWLSEDKFNERFNPVQTRTVQRKDGSVAVIADERSGRHAELQNRLRANFMCRHEKRDVLKQLKLPVYDLVLAEETSQVKAALKAESLLGIDPDNLEGANIAVLGHIAEARRTMGEALAPQAVAYSRMLLAGGVEKLVIFYWHISVGHILAAGLAAHGVVKVDGSTSAVAKDALVQKFIEDPNCRVVIGNMLSLGTGTDGLQLVCGHALLAEADWTAGTNQQCIDRLDRGGQTRSVMADILVAPNSISEKVLGASLRKLRVTHNALDRRFG